MLIAACAVGVCARTARGTRPRSPPLVRARTAHASSSASPSFVSSCRPTLRRQLGNALRDAVDPEVFAGSLRHSVPTTIDATLDTCARREQHGQNPVTDTWAHSGDTGAQPIPAAKPLSSKGGWRARYDAERGGQSTRLSPLVGGQITDRLPRWSSKARRGTPASASDEPCRSRHLLPAIGEPSDARVSRAAFLAPRHRVRPQRGEAKGWRLRVARRSRQYSSG